MKVCLSFKRLSTIRYGRLYGFELVRSRRVAYHNPTLQKTQTRVGPGGSPTIPPLRHAHRPAPPWLPTPLAAGAPFGGTSVKIGTIQRRLAWPLRKDDTHKSRMYHFFDTNDTLWCSGCCSVLGSVARVCDPSGDQATVEWLAVPSVPSRAYSEVCPSEGRGDQRLPA